MRLWCAAIPLLLAGCAKPDVDACERYAKALLDAPGGYRRVAVDIEERPATADELVTAAGYNSRIALGREYAKLVDPAGLGLRRVTLGYETAAGRETRICAFATHGGRLDAADELGARADRAAEREKLDALLDASGHRGDRRRIDRTRYANPEQPCCLI